MGRFVLLCLSLALLLAGTSAVAVSRGSAGLRGRGLERSLRALMAIGIPCKSVTMPCSKVDSSSASQCECPMSSHCGDGPWYEQGFETWYCKPF